jgi:ribosomal protein S12 methylthiotransferase accessory factor
MLARAEDVESGAEAWIPAELAFNPGPPNSGPSLFGSSSNGLASGNSVLEASLHALYELIERDIWSFDFLRDRAAPVEAIPPHLVHPLWEASASNGLRLVIHHVPNDYGIPFFAAFLFDPGRPESRLFNGGWGCHPIRDVALTRALTEVAQSRLAFLLGFRQAGETDAERIKRQTELLSEKKAALRYEEIPDAPPASSLREQWTDALRCLRRVVDRPVYRVVYTPPEGPLHVVRLVVPLLEHFTPADKRMGPRMRAELEAMAELQARA